MVGIKFGDEGGQVVGDALLEGVGQVHLWGDDSRFDAEDNDFVGALIDHFCQFDDTEDIDFVERQMGHFFDGVDIVGGEASYRPRLKTHFGAIDEDNFFALGDRVEQIHAAAAAVEIFYCIRRQLSGFGQT